MLATITNVFKKEDCNIISMREYNDIANDLCFVRIEAEHFNDVNRLEIKLNIVLPAGAIVKLNMLPEKKIIVLVTKEYHCLADILIRNQFKTPGASVQCVIGNHATLQTIFERFEVPFHLVSHERKEKEIFEKELPGIIHKYEMDYLVLAKFMHILSPQFAEKFPMRIINIHHSFLPAFYWRKSLQAGVSAWCKTYWRHCTFCNE